MKNFDDIRYEFSTLLQDGPNSDLERAENLLDEVAECGVEELSRTWGVPLSRAQHFVVYTYNSVGVFHFMRAQSLSRQTSNTGLVQVGAMHAERCHEKAFDVFDMSAEDMLLIPVFHPIPNDEESEPHPLARVIIFTFWGLGVMKYVLKKHEESERYLRFCLGFPAKDEQALTWQSDASIYLHKLLKKPSKVKLVVEDADIYIHERDVILVRGELVSWDTFARPMLEEFKVWLNMNGMSQYQLARILLAMEGQTITLMTDESCDLFRPLNLLIPDEEI